MDKPVTSEEQIAYKCGIFIHRGLYDRIWAETVEKHSGPRNPELTRDLLDWHHFYRAFLDSLPLLTQEQELELLTRWQLGGDIDARDHLILCLAGNVGKIAGRMVTRRFPMRGRVARGRSRNYRLRQSWTRRCSQQDHLVAWLSPFDGSQPVDQEIHP
jgi:hypothetical protein